MQLYQRCSQLSINFHPTDSSDYRLGETMLMFQPGSASSTVCTAITTAPDCGEESNETVVVQVVPVAPDTTPGGEQRSLTVNILNNDGKYIS